MFVVSPVTLMASTTDWLALYPLICGLVTAGNCPPVGLQAPYVVCPVTLSFVVDRVKVNVFVYGSAACVPFWN